VNGHAPAFSGPAAAVIRRTVSLAVLVIAGLAFAFGFGNGWLLGLDLGVPGWIAPLVAPAVDLSVVAPLASLHYLRARGVTDALVAARLLLWICGLITCALNTARPVLAGAVGRACFDAVAPLLLIGWSEVGPRLLALLHQSVPDTERAVPDTPLLVSDRPSIRPELLSAARQLDRDHRTSTGRPLTRDKLRAALHVSNSVAGELVRCLHESE
jgi:hypothetical protein